MRHTLVSALALAALAPLAGCSSKACKDNTAFVKITLGSAAQSADAVTLIILVDGTQRQTSNATLSLAGKQSGTVEIDFASFPRNSMLEVDVLAARGGTVIARGSASTTLSGSCGSLDLNVADVYTADLAMADLTVMPVATIVPKPDFIGFTTSVDGSTSSDGMGQTLTYTWTLLTVPTNSSITASSLSGANTSMLSFFPDLGGTYRVQLMVTATDGRSNTAQADVVVPTWPVYFGHGTGDTVTSSSTETVIRSDGTGEKAIGCPMIVDAGWNTNNGLQLPAIAAFGGRRAWQPGPGVAGASYDIFWYTTTIIDGSGNLGGFQPQLYVGRDTTDCVTVMPVRVDQQPIAGLVPALPRPSPDGTRVAYLEAAIMGGSNNYSIVTVSADGSGNLHRIRGGIQSQVPPFWVDSTHVLWVENTSGASTVQTVVSALDATGAGSLGDPNRTVLLTCDSAVTNHLTDNIDQVAKTPFGLLVSTAKRLLLMQAGNCDVTQAQTIADESTAGYSSSQVGDLDLSPDGQIYILSGTMNWNTDLGSTARRRLFIGNTDGSSPPQPFSTTTFDEDQVGPLFVTHGRQIVWSEIDMRSGSGGRIVIANLDGTQRRVLRTTQPIPGGDLGNDFVFAGVNSLGCSYGGVVGGGTVLGALALLLGMIAARTLWLRRRRH